MKFEVRVPDGDDGKSLGSFEAEALPRVGDAFFVHHPLVCVRAHPFEAKVDAITWESFYEEAEPSVRSAVSMAEPVVWLAETAGIVTVYCVCTDREREESKKGHLGDGEYEDKPDGRCFNCGDQRKPEPEILF